MKAGVPHIPRVAVALGICALAATLVAGASAVTRSSSQTLVVDTNFGLVTLDPTYGQTQTRLVNHQRFDTLLTYNAGVLTPVPDIATSYSASPRAKVWTFHLRHDVHFADGTPLTSADVVFSLQRAIALGGDGASVIPHCSVSAPDAYTVVINSTVPNAAIPAAVTSPMLAILNSKLAMAHGATDAANAATTDTAGPWLSSGASQGIGSGPYTLAEYDPNSQVIMGRNVKYWRARPKFDKVVIRNVPSQAQLLDVQRGADEIALDLGAQDVAGLSTASLNIVRAPSAQTFLFFSNDSPSISAVSSNKNLQQAIRYAIDYTAILQLAGYGAVRPSGEIPPFFDGALKTKDGVKQDISKAKSLVAASGLSNPTITLEYPSDRTINGLSFGSIAQIIQSNLQQAGITVNLAGEPVTTVLQRYLAGLIPWALVPNLPSVMDVTELSRLLPGGILGLHVGWAANADPSLSQAQLKAELKPGNARYALWGAVQQQLNADGPWIGLVNPVAVLASTKDLSGVAFNPTWTVDFASVTPAKA